MCQGKSVNSASLPDEGQVRGGSNRTAVRNNFQEWFDIPAEAATLSPFVQNGVSVTKAGNPQVNSVQ
jgi:hypothetical protein